VVSLGRLGHETTDEVIGDKEPFEFLVQHGWTRKSPRKGSAHGMVRFSFVRGIALRCIGSFPPSAVQ
jgi:hypothetical protein